LIKTTTDLKLGQIFTEKFVITQNIYERFIELFNDKNPLHTSESFAKEFGFSSKVMHGNILNGFLSYFIGECLPFKNIIIHNQSISYNNPVFLNDELNLTVTVNEIFESVNAVEFKFSFSNNLNQRIAKGKFQIGVLNL
jgi:3-hydroxybutyryl-CoA dehydratase